MERTAGKPAGLFAPVGALALALVMVGGCAAAPAKSAAKPPRPAAVAAPDARESTAAATPEVAPEASVAPDNLTYDERRTQEMYRLVDRLKAATDPDERRALQLQILPLAGGCVRDEPELLKNH